MTPAENLKKALNGHEPGKNQFAQVTAGDVVAAGKAVRDPKDDVAAILKGCAAVRPDRLAYVPVDALLQLIEVCGGPVLPGA